MQAFLASFFFLFFITEWVIQHQPDADYYRKPHPPPLDYPNKVETPDTMHFNLWKTEEFRKRIDNGQLGECPFDIVDGKKVYKKFVGLNQPLERI